MFTKTFMFFCGVCFVTGILIIFSAVIFEEFGERKEIGRSAPGEFGCYVATEELSLFGFSMEDDTVRCPSTPTTDR